jgi:hypothetical protein
MSRALSDAVRNDDEAVPLSRKFLPDACRKLQAVGAREGRPRGVRKLPLVSPEPDRVTE